jgi:nucleoside 2-deoxyribosyltransferase
MDIQIFAGFQFSSGFFSRIALESYVDEAVSMLNRELARHPSHRRTKLHYKVTDIDSGSRIRDYLSQQIDNSDICIFELSDRNANVLFELGYAYSRNKRIIYLVHEDINIELLPSDLDGTFYRKYREENLGIAVADELRTKVLALVKEIRSQASFFDFGESAVVNLVCPEIPLKYRIKYAERFSKDYLYKAKFGDSDTLGELQTHLARAYPQLRLREYVSTEVPRELFGEPLICIGGPGWNGVTRDILDHFDVPLEYGDYSDAVQDFYIKDKLRDVERRTEFSRGRIIHDVGVIGRLPNVQSSRMDIYIINGIQTFGVLGSARSLIEDEYRFGNMQTLSEVLGEDRRYFVALLSIAVIEGNPSPAFVRAEDVFIFDPKARNFTLGDSSA